MFIPTTNYWNVINGTTPDEVFEDEEGMQIMRVLGNNMAFLMNALEGTKAYYVCSKKWKESIYMFCKIKIYLKTS